MSMASSTCDHRSNTQTRSIIAHSEHVPRRNCISAKRTTHTWFILILLPTYDWGTSALFLRVVVSVSNVSLSYPSRHYIITFQSLKSSDKFLMDIHLRTTGCRLPYGITQYYGLPPDTSEHTPPSFTENFKVQT